MKLQLTVLAVLLAIFAFSQDTSHHGGGYRRNAMAALKAREQSETKPQPVTIRTDSSKNWKKYLVMQQKEKNWWDYTKDIFAGIWKDKPWLLILASIFLLGGIWRLVKRIFD